ncbi:MAG: hypothetical protein ABL908_14060 [Hyphomicrobium sp.]
MAAKKGSAKKSSAPSARLPEVEFEKLKVNADLAAASNAFAGFKHLDDAAFSRLEKAGGLVLDLGARRRLDQIIGDHDRFGQYFQLVEPDQLRILKAVEKSGQALAKALDAAAKLPFLESLLVISRRQLNEIVHDHSLPIVEEAHEARIALHRHAKTTRGLAEHAGRELQSLNARSKKDGPRRDLPTEKLLSDVIRFFRKQGGHIGISEKSKGPLASFLAALWPHLSKGCRPKTDGALIRAASVFITQMNRRLGANTTHAS